MISKKVSGLILVISLDYVDRRLPKESINRISINESNFLGYITNSVNNNDDENDNLNYGSYGKYKQFNKYSYSNYIDEDNIRLQKRSEINKTSYPEDRKRLVAFKIIFKKISTKFKSLRARLDS